MPRRRRATQADVARLAGVSAAVVSSVLSEGAAGNIRVSPETEARVRAAVKELGYVPNIVARNLASGRNRMIGVFTFNSIFPVEQRDFYYPFLLGIEQAAEDFAHDVLLFTSTRATGGRRSIFHEGVNRLQLADGAVLLGEEEAKGELTRLSEQGFPFVFVGRRELKGHSVSYVAGDYVGATRDVVTYLAEQGHRCLLYVGDPHERESTVDRQKGFEEATTSLALSASSANVVRLGLSEVTASSVRSWLDSGVTAFIAENDTLATRVLEVARELGYSVPRDLSIALLGDPFHVSDDAPTWTTFQIPRRDMGYQSVEVLLDLLARGDETTLRRILPCNFVPGTTTAVAPARSGR